MDRTTLFKGIKTPTTAVRRLPIYQDDGRFRLIVDQLLDQRRADTLQHDDLLLYIGYLFGVIVDLQQAKETHG